MADDSESARRAVEKDRENLLHVFFDPERAAEKRQEDLLYEQKKELFKAAENNDLKTLKHLVEEKAVPLKSFDDDAQTAAYIAAKHGHLDMLKYIGDKNPSILSNRERNGNTILHLPDEKNVLEIIHYLEEKFNAGTLDWERTDFESMGIHAAAQFAHWNVLKYFLEQKKSDVNAANDQGDPPIFTAVKYEHRDVFKYLVEEKRANLTKLNDNDDNILFVAVGQDDLPTMKYVLDERKAPIDVNWRNEFGNTLVHRAAIQNRLAILEYLVEQKHADVNVLGYENRTALSHASSRNYYEICKYLVEHGADPHLKDQFGFYPVQRAFEKRLVEYMNNVSWPLRTRRSIESFQPIQLARQHTLQGAGSSRLENRWNGVNGGSLYPSEVPNFLVLAASVFGNAKRFGYRRSRQLTYFDAIAEEAIDVPNFNDD